MTAMEQIAEISCKARAMGITYGEYVKMNRPGFTAQTKKAQTRICQTCGEAFEPPTLKNGGISRRVNCNRCVEEKREKNGLPPAKNFTTVYIVHCHKCGRTMESRRVPGKGVRFTCKKCKKNHSREYQREYWKRKGGRANADK